MDGVGIEKTAEFCFKVAQTFLKETYGDRCWVEKVEVFEHEANSAFYSEPRQIVYSTSITTPSPSTYTTPSEATTFEEPKQPEVLKPDPVIYPIETPSAPAAPEKPKNGPVPLHGNGVTNGYSGLFDNISWGSR